MNSITLDSTHCLTDLCTICVGTGTDKTPHAKQGHRHPYTTPYSLFFEPLRNRKIKFAEIGIAHGSSLVAWQDFFTKANIYGFDREPHFLQVARSRLRTEGITLDLIDASSSESVKEVLTKHTEDGELFDVIIDDASHDPMHQKEVIKSAIHFLKQGGLLIVEDIFRDRPIAPYEEVFEEIKDLVSFHTFIVCDHANRYSPGWNNDKLLVFVRA
jgi:predicted O-methyltransferase YrrM